MIDISLGTTRNRLCSGVSRRDFVRVGGLGALGLSLSGFLSLQKALAAGPSTAPSAPRAKSIILVYLGGGISHHDSFDYKPDAPEAIRGKYKTIKSNVAGTHVGELLPKMAQTMDKVCLVRSGSHENDHHETATNWVLSGRFGSPFGDYPAMGAVVAHETGFSGVVPPYVAIPKNPAFTWELGKSAFLGGRYESFKAGDPNQKNYKIRDLAMSEPMTSQAMQRRESLLKAVDTLSSQIKGNDQLATYDEFQRRAAEMVLSKEAQAAFDIEQESHLTREAYGRTEFGQSCLLARRLIEGGVKFVTVNSAGWDHHKEIWKGLDRMLPIFDQGFAALINDMSQRGLLKDTLVACFGEFGRTPKINKDVGRDHWAKAASLLFAGAGVRGGKVIGATDKIGAFVTDRPIRPADVAATIYDALGINSRKHIHTPEGRPVEILGEGSVIHDLYT